MKEHIFPHERAFNAHATSPHRWTIPPLIDTLKVKAQQLGLWNLWIPPSLVSSIHAVLGAADPGLVASLDLGPGLSNVEYAFLSEQMGRVWWASEVFNCGAPDTGNMEVCCLFGCGGVGVVVWCVGVVGCCGGCTMTFHTTCATHCFSSYTYSHTLSHTHTPTHTHSHSGVGQVWQCITTAYMASTTPTGHNTFLFCND